MKKLLILTLAIVSMAAGAALYAAATMKTYQVTGPVLEVRPDAIVVQKGADKWEIGRDAGTKVKGDLKVGAKVTIMYRMTATDVDVKPETAAKSKKKSGN